MHDALFDQLPTDLTSSINKTILKLKKRLITEGIKHFEHIIAEFGAEKIYALSFYYSAGDWGYIVPTFATEQGLEEISKGCDAENKQLIRWSPCDSHHPAAHGFHFSNKMNEILHELRMFTDEASDYIKEKKLPNKDNRAAYITVIIEIHQLIHDHVIEALQQVALAPKVVEYVEKHRCLIVLEAGDMDPDVLAQDLVTLNGEAAITAMKSWDE